MKEEDKKITFRVNEDALWDKYQIWLKQVKNDKSLTINDELNESLKMFLKNRLGSKLFKLNIEPIEKAFTKMSRTENYRLMHYLQKLFIDISTSLVSLEIKTNFLINCLIKNEKTKNEPNFLNVRECEAVEPFIDDNIKKVNKLIKRALPREYK